MAGGSDERKFGVVYFDDDQDPGAGWCAYVEGQRAVARRIMGPNELATDTVWWSNVSYDHFFRRSEAFRNPNLRHDKYLVVSPKDVLKEWGYNPDTVETHFICEFCAQVFDRVMRMAWNLLSEVNPKLRIDQAFLGKTLREDLRPLLKNLEYPKGVAARVIKSGYAWEEFTATTVRTPKGGKFVVLRRPRLSYAMEMLQTPVPKGPFEHMTRGDLKSDPKARLDYVRGVKTPCMVEVTVNSIQPEIAPIYGFGAAVDKDKRVPRSWVAHPEFMLLSRLAKIDVRSLYQGREYWAMVPDMPAAVSGFLSDIYCEFSWSAGIVAESLWRAVALGEEKSKAGPLRDGEERAQTSWQGAWIRAADKSAMFLMSMRLTELGYAVASYGLGWIRCSVPDEDVVNLIKDGLTLGLVPVLSDIPEGSFAHGKPVQWSGDPKCRNFVSLTVTKNNSMLWNLDKTPLIAPGRRPEYIRKLQERFKSNA